MSFFGGDLTWNDPKWTFKGETETNCRVRWTINL